jgi:metallo-beta-lactamase class B
MAALQRLSGATVAASPSGALALEQGGPPADDPQFAFGHQANDYPPVKGVRVVKDGETLRVGTLAITAHLTPGHTPGSTAWTWRSCEGSRCLDIVYADSLNPVSAPGFRFTGDGSRPSLVDSFRRSIAKVAGLPCDVILAVHPSFADLDGKLQRREQGTGSDPFVDPHACVAYAADATKRLDQRVAEERGRPRP